MPSAHDLLVHFFLRHRFKVTKIIISHVDEEFSSALIHYRKGPRQYRIEALPADAIAIALRLGLLIYLTEEAAADMHNRAVVDSLFSGQNQSYLYVEPYEKRA